MYTKKLGFKNYKNIVRNEEHTFQLEVRDVFKNMVELWNINEWIKKLQDQPGLNETPTAEVVEFYDNIETLLLASWGVISDNGDRFERTGRYAFEDSKAFAVFMEEFLGDPSMANDFLTQIMPENMTGFIDKLSKGEAEATAALAKAGNKTPEEIEREIAKLRGELETATAEGDAVTPTA